MLKAGDRGASLVPCTLKARVIVVQASVRQDVGPAQDPRPQNRQQRSASNRPWQRWHPKISVQHAFPLRSQWRKCRANSKATAVRQGGGTFNEGWRITV